MRPVYSEGAYAELLGISAVGHKHSIIAQQQDADAREMQKDVTGKNASRKVAYNGVFVVHLTSENEPK